MHLETGRLSPAVGFFCSSRWSSSMHLGGQGQRNAILINGPQRISACGALNEFSRRRSPRVPPNFECSGSTHRICRAPGSRPDHGACNQNLAVQRPLCRWRHRPPPLFDDDFLGPSDAFLRTKQAREILERVSALKPTTLAPMHGSSWHGDGARLLLALVDSFGMHARLSGRYRP